MATPAKKKTTMNNNEKDRIGHVEDEIGDLKTSFVKLDTTVSGFDTRISGMEGNIGNLNTGMNQLLQRGSGWEATKDMMSKSTVMWGVGILVSLLTIGLYMLDRSDSSTDLKVAVVSTKINNEVAELREDMKSYAERSDEKHDASIDDRKSLNLDLRIAQDNALVNKTIAEERHRSQQMWNTRQDLQTAKIENRQITFYDEFEDVRRNLATKATVKDLQIVNADQQKQISLIREEAASLLADMKYVKMQQDRRFPAIIESAKRSGDSEARIKQVEEDLDKRWPILVEATTQLGQLKPLIKGIGLTLPNGNEQRIDMLEKLLDAVDKDGSRGTNLRLKAGQ